MTPGGKRIGRQGGRGPSVLSWIRMAYNMRVDKNIEWDALSIQSSASEQILKFSCLKTTKYPSAAPPILPSLTHIITATVSG